MERLRCLMGEWANKNVWPSYIVMSFDALEALGKEAGPGVMKDGNGYRFWGVPIILAELPSDSAYMATENVADIRHALGLID